jgi:hypothetical protein
MSIEHLLNFVYSIFKVFRAPIKRCFLLPMEIIDVQKLPGMGIEMHGTTPHQTPSAPGSRKTIPLSKFMNRPGISLQVRAPFKETHLQSISSSGMDTLLGNSGRQD